MAGLYIHIPFCTSRCLYCGFYSTTLSPLRQRYVEALCREMQLRPLTSGQIETVYLGGGTPSTLSREQLELLFHYIYKVYPIAPNAEVTIECNPDDVCSPHFALPAPVNRVSMGAQTFNDGRLHFIRRRHSARQVDEAVSRLRAMGIRNVSIDLIFGFPGETLDEWQNDIDHALALQVEHISAYSLMYEEGTPLYRMLDEGAIEEIDEELSLNMYDTLTDRLAAAGYEHYEISNFALPGFRSRHNSSYWHEIPYIGIGAAAHSYDRLTRQWNVPNLEAYLSAIEEGRIPCEAETIDEATRYDDLVTTALRTREGINVHTLTPPYREHLLRQAQPYIDRGLLDMEQGQLHLTRQGIYVSDSIMADLMYV